MSAYLYWRIDVANPELLREVFASGTIEQGIGIGLAFVDGNGGHLTSGAA